MNDTWIYKADGTIQCNKEIQAIPFAVMAGPLAEIINESSIISQKKYRFKTIQQCGTPTGAINAFELTPDGFELWDRGIVGHLGFEKLDLTKVTEDVDAASLPSFADMSEAKPQYIGELVGRPLRVYRTGDMLTADYRPSRCNIETSESGEGNIVRVWFG